MSFQFMGGFSQISLFQFQTLSGALGLTSFMKGIISIIRLPNTFLMVINRQNTFIFYTYYCKTMHSIQYPMKPFNINAIQSPHRSNSLYALKDQGLPNFGNTCYINSIIQYLYSSSEFQDFLRKSAQTKRVDTVIYRLKEVFRAISSAASIEAKEKALQRLIKQIWASNPELNFKYQQDSFQILLVMLNQMSEQDPIIQQLFEIQLQNSCGCNISRTNSFYLDNSVSTCLQCRRQIQTRLLNYSNLLVIKADKYETIHKTYFKLFEEKVLYKCIGRVFYVGNQQLGHYRASRIHNNQFFEFQDLEIFLQFDTYPYFLLYQKIELDTSSQKEPVKSIDVPIMLDKISDRTYQVVKISDDAEQLANKYTILTKDGLKTQVLVSQDTKYEENTDYQAKIKIASPIIEGESIKFYRKIYFNFIVTSQQQSFMIEMKVKNQVKDLNPKKKVAHLGIKTSKLHIASFLESYESNVKNYIDKKVSRLPNEQQFDAFLNNMESILAQIGGKDIPQRLVIINRKV